MKNIFNLKLSIRPRLILLFLAQIVIVIFVAGIFLQWHLRNQLETELGKHLETVARMVSLQMESEILANLLPGDEPSRSYRIIHEALQVIQTHTAMKRIFIFDRQRRSLIDTESGTPIGWEYFQLTFDQNEVTRVFNGESVSSVLFAGEDGKLYKSGYAPIFFATKVIAAVRVEGSARTLEAIADLRRRLLQLGIFAVLGAILLAIIFSNQLTRPLKQLQQAASEIGRGNYRQAIQLQSRDEVGFLARTLEEMRKNINQRDLQQKTLIAGVAHEIRNPLGGIELFAGILTDDLPPGETKTQAEKILKEVKNLKKIVQDFLDYARPPSPQKQVCSPVSIFKDTTQLLAPGLKSIRLELDAAPPDLKIDFDPQHLKQIFLNLLANAIQAVSQNGLISVTLRENPAGAVEIIFADNGRGVPPGDRGKIFDPFFTTRETGAGLGLSIVKSLVEANGGRIELLNPKHGAAFRLIVPEISE
jgi:signal transduction histidine kinase